MRGSTGLFLLAVYIAIAPPAWAQTRVPLRQGLTIVTALSDRLGDYESIKAVEAVGTEAIRLTYSADVPEPARAGRGATSRKIAVQRTVRRDDLRTSHEYLQTFNPNAANVFPGTTAIGTSAAVLAELKTIGRSAFTFETPGRLPSKASGALTRVEAGAVPFPVLVNGQRVTVPAIHARGTFDDLKVDFLFLDDPDNPLALKWSTGTASGALQVVQITYPLDQLTPQIETALTQSGRAEVHGIYFDFASATIRQQSDAVLKEIADALAKNPTWTLRIEGHTDNIGGDPANMELSTRRAEAVKQALVTRYRVDAARLATAGLGATQPKESNDTAEGRARNRRVELVRR
jgi:outer membrane protein OmpA-like peptidoglycan-associated protein